MGSDPADALAAAAGGDRDALSRLFREFHAPLLRYLRARRVAAPDDVASEVWVDVARSIDRFRGGHDDFRRWLFTIAHRRAVDAVRRAVRRKEEPADLASASSTAAVPLAEAAEVEYARRDALERALDLVSTLPDNLAEAVMLKVVFELPAADVAVIMDTSEGNVRVLVHRGLERLRRKLSVTDAAAQTMRVVS